MKRRAGETYVSSRFRAVQKTRPCRYNVKIRTASTGTTFGDVQAVLARNRSVRDLIADSRIGPLLAAQFPWKTLGPGEIVLPINKAKDYLG